MTDTLDTSGTPTPESTTSAADKMPAGTPEPETGHQSDDIDLLDLDADDGEEAASTDVASTDAPQQRDTDTTGRPSWQRPEGLEGDELVEWKEAQGLPIDAEGYEVNLDLKEGQRITEAGQQLIDGLKGFAVDHDLAPPAVNSLVNWYNQQIEAQYAKRAEADKTLRTETRDTLTERWGDAYAERLEIAKEGARVLPQALRAMLKEARTPDGRRIANTVELRQALFEIGRLRSEGHNNVLPSDEERLAEITKIRDTQGIDEYRAKGLDRESLEIMRRIDAAKTQARVPGTLTPAEEAEERELIQMMQTDIHAYSRPFRGLGITGSDRLLQLRRKRDGAAA